MQQAQESPKYQYLWQGKAFQQRIVTKEQQTHLDKFPMSKLFFTPYAWAKLVHMRDKIACEVSGMGITPKLPNLVEDVYFPKQEVQSAYVDIDEDGFAEMVDELASKGLRPDQFMRIWIHTHPSGMGPNPSGRDNQCMDEAFSSPDWAIMMIVAKDGKTFAQMRVNKPFRIESLLDVMIDYKAEFPGSNITAWDAEYNKNVTQYTHQSSQQTGYGYSYEQNNMSSTREMAMGIMQKHKWTEKICNECADIASKAFINTTMVIADVLGALESIACGDHKLADNDPRWMGMYAEIHKASDFRRRPMAEMLALLVKAMTGYATTGHLILIAYDKYKHLIVDPKKNEDGKNQNVLDHVVG